MDMALTPRLHLGTTMPLLFFFFFLQRAEAAGELGVSYGRVANDLPDPATVAQLLADTGITMVRIYDADPTVLNSLANTGIKVMVTLPNANLPAAASDPNYALQWVQGNVAAFYPDTLIHGVAVGNEVFKTSPQLNADLVPAMANVQRALAQLGLDDAVKVSSPIAFDAVEASWPPSAARFRDDVAQPVMAPMLEFLQRTGSYLSVNYFPFLTYMAAPQNFALDYVLGNCDAAAGVEDSGNHLVYHSLLDAQRDATYHAMAKMGFSSLSVTQTEHGVPGGGGLHPGGVGVGVGGGRKLLDEAAVASVANAQTYMNNLMDSVLCGSTGTPYRPDADMDVYIFELFNENQKGTGPDDVEQHFGLFYPNMTKVYDFDFRRDCNV